MKKKMTTVPFSGTQEQESKLFDIIEKYAGVKGSLMPILQEAQALYGYLPIEVQKLISQGTGASLAEIYGIVSFYSQFTLNFKGDYSIAVCLGTACYVKGSAEIIDRIGKIIGIKPGETTADGKYSLDETRCIGACGLAPVFTVNEDVYGRIARPEEVDVILAKYKK